MKNKKKSVAHTIGEIKFEDRFLLTAMKSVGYDTYTAIYELLDNSIDAESSEIWITYEDDIIIVEDNGKGMDSETLVKAMNFGFEREYGEDEISYFGVGLKSSIINLINDKKNPYANILSNDGESSTLITWKPLDDLRQFTIEEIKGDIKKGTKITLYGVDKFNLSTLKKNLGVIYYHSIKSEIDSPVSIFVNNEKIEGNDPLYRKSSLTIKNWMIAKVLNTDIKIEVSALNPTIEKHSWDRRKQNDDEGVFTYRKGGIYVVYGGRYIEFGGGLGVFANHPNIAQARIEFTIPKELTETFHIKFNKTQGLDLSHELERNEALSDLIRKLKDCLNWAVRNRTRKEVATKDEITEMNNLADELNKAAKNARVQKPKKDIKDSTTEKGKRKDGSDGGSKDEKPKGDKKTRIRKYEPYKIVFENLGNTAVFWHLGYQNNQFVITLNDGHVFYTEMWRNMNESAKSSLVFLLGAIALSQYYTTQSDVVPNTNINIDYFWEEFWSQVSLKLRHLIINR
jgi:hypothetical protein